MKRKNGMDERKELWIVSAPLSFKAEGEDGDGIEK